MQEGALGIPHTPDHRLHPTELDVVSHRSNVPGVFDKQTPESQVQRSDAVEREVVRVRSPGWRPDSDAAIGRDKFTAL
jgi:hypothetical protein